MNEHNGRIMPAGAPSDDVRHLLELRDHLRRSLEIVEAQLGHEQLPGHGGLRAGGAEILHGYAAIGAYLGLTADAARNRCARQGIPVVQSGRRVWIRRGTLDGRLASLEASAAAEA